MEHRKPTAPNRASRPEAPSLFARPAENEIGDDDRFDRDSDDSAADNPRYRHQKIAGEGRGQCFEAIDRCIHLRRRAAIVTAWQPANEEPILSPFRAQDDAHEHEHPLTLGILGPPGVERDEDPGSRVPVGGPGDLWPE